MASHREPVPSPLSIPGDEGLPIRAPTPWLSWEFSPEDGERFDLNEGLVFAIFGVEMCRAVVSKVHSNHDPEESSYLRYFFFRFYPLRRRRAWKPHRPCTTTPAIGTPRTHSLTDQTVATYGWGTILWFDAAER